MDLNQQKRLKMKQLVHAEAPPKMPSHKTVVSAGKALDRPPDKCSGAMEVDGKQEKSDMQKPMREAEGGEGVMRPTGNSAGQEEGTAMEVSQGTS